MAEHTKMAQTGYTPISIYYSATASNTPTAGNLVAGELAINTADGKLFYKDSAGAVQVIGTKGGVGSSTTTQVLYNSSGLVVGSANMTYTSTGLTVNGITQAYQTGLYNVDGTLSNYASNNGVYLNGNASGYLRLSNDGAGATKINLNGASYSTPNQIEMFTAGSQRAVIDASGNLGIGVATVYAPLQVKTTSATTYAMKVSSAGQSDGGIALGDGSSTQFGVGIARWNGSTNASGSGGMGYFSQGAGNGGGHYFYTGDTVAGSQTERMRIDTSGIIWAGLTTYGGAPGRIVASYNAGQYGIRIITTVSGSSNAMQFTNSTGGEVGTIGINGTNTSYNTSSDYRLKNTIAPMTGALDKVAKLKPCTYKWNYDNSDGQGFIAHELAEVAPQAVNGEKDAVDAEGKPVYQGIDTSFLVATLTAAIQELNAKVDAQATTIAALQAKVG